MTITTIYSPDQYVASGATDTYTYTFEIFADADIDVYVDTVLQTLTTDYTVTGSGSETGGTVVFVVTPTSGQALTFARSIQSDRVADYQPSGDFSADTINTELDRNIAKIQEIENVATRVISLAVTSTYTGSLELDTPSANDVISVKASGLGIEWIANPAIAAAASAAAAATSETNAGISETLASEWASKVIGVVASSEYSAKAYAIGGTGVTTTAGKGAAKEWAITTGAMVDTADYSAKEYAVGTTVAAGSSKDWASITGAMVDGADYSAKEYAVGTTVAAGSSKEWSMTVEDTLVDGVSYSALHYSAKASADAAFVGNFGMPFFYVQPEVYTYTLDYHSTTAYTIDKLYIKSGSGTATITVAINGTAVTGLTAVAVSTVEATPTATAANSVAVGDKVTIEYTAVSTVSDVEGKLEISSV